VASWTPSAAAVAEAFLLALEIRSERGAKLLRSSFLTTDPRQDAAHELARRGLVAKRECLYGNIPVQRQGLRFPSCHDDVSMEAWLTA
jgi:hypothetical protein